MLPNSLKALEGNDGRRLAVYNSMRGQRGSADAIRRYSGRETSASKSVKNTLKLDDFLTPRSPAQHVGHHSKFLTRHSNSGPDGGRQASGGGSNGGEGWRGGGENTPRGSARGGAAFMTARGGNESELETARDTAREGETRGGQNGAEGTVVKGGGGGTGFETDDYMSTFEPEDTFRTTNAFGDDDDDLEARRGGASTYGAGPYHCSTDDTENTRAGSRLLQTNRVGEARNRYWANQHKYNKAWDEQPALPQRGSNQGWPGEKPCGGVSGTGYSNRTWRDLAEKAGPSTRQQRVAMQETTNKTKEKGGGKEYFGFRQNMVEDIFSYARHNRVEDVERMVDQGVPVDVRDGHGNTILIVACQNGHKRILKTALRRGANANATNARGNTALHFCYAFGYGDTLGRYLMDKGADPSIRNRTGLVCYDGIGH